MVLDVVEVGSDGATVLWRVEARVELIEGRPSITRIVLDSAVGLQPQMLQVKFRWATPLDVVTRAVPQLIADGIDPFDYEYPIRNFPDAADVGRAQGRRLTDAFLADVAQRYVALGAVMRRSSRPSAMCRRGRSSAGSRRPGSAASSRAPGRARSAGNTCPSRPAARIAAERLPWRRRGEPMGPVGATRSGGCGTRLPEGWAAQLTSQKSSYWGARVPVAIGRIGLMTPSASLPRKMAVVLGAETFVVIVLLALAGSDLPPPVGFVVAIPVGLLLGVAVGAATVPLLRRIDREGAVRALLTSVLGGAAIGAGPAWCCSWRVSRWIRR